MKCCHLLTARTRASPPTTTERPAQLIISVQPTVCRPAMSGHNHYGFWGPGHNSNEVVVAIGYREGFLRQFFDDVQRKATISPQ